jgi:hypothetical protein
MTDVPTFLIEWSSPWKEFWSSIIPALSRSARPLAGEAAMPLFPVRGMLGACVVEGLILFTVIILPGEVAKLLPRVTTPNQAATYEHIYYGPELPQTEDEGGAETGRSGRAGGKQAHHATQTIRVARGRSMTEKVVDAPQLKLPSTGLPVANLLAVNRLPGPPPTEALKSDRRHAALQEQVVPPAPTVEREHLSGPALTTRVVPPAPTVTRDQLSAPSLNTAVVPPAPTVESAASRSSSFGTPQVVPPPVSAPVTPLSTQARLNMPAPAVVPPPPSGVTRETGGIGNGGLSDSRNVIPPPPSASSGSSLFGRAIQGLAESLGVAPPAPTIPEGTVRAAGGGGAGTRGSGQGGPLDLGSQIAPPNSGGNGAKQTGVVVSTQPGSTLGKPEGGIAGSLAMSPGGRAATGLGGSGNGGGIGNGDGPGSGLEGTGPGAGKTGTGLGADPAAKGGTSPYPGRGGAGTGNHQNYPTTAGISVQGGTAGIVNLPSFGPGGSAPSTSGRSAITPDKGPAVIVEATPRAGGGFDRYGLLRGEKVYTIYLQTTVGEAVLTYSDPESQGRAYAEMLSAPSPLRAELPDGLGRPRVAVLCTIDTRGQFHLVKMIEGSTTPVSARLLGSLSGWRFRPAMRGDQPVQVTAILGFNIDTRNTR